ncbi:hypothetical protein [Rhodoblastus sp.]|uniref:hypothetical protein n=1 Tax=Rhodoblastus sp. TaxID=1962975 RepID=UPI003F9D813A
MARLAFALLLLAAASLSALAAGDPCAKIKDADAYNSCLAASGPVFHEGRFKPAPQAAREKHRRGRSYRAAASRKGGRRHSHGRVRITIDPGQ